MVNALSCARRGACVFVGLLALPTFLVRADNPPAAPTASPAPSLTERQASLLMQLAEAEANIKTINKALVRTGYKVGLAYEQVESSQKGNELMDRKGGGPVGWEQFYGNTAAGFYYHSSAQLRYDKGHGNTTLDYQANGSRLTRVDRPAQFDFIYRANEDQMSRAKDQIASLAQNQAALLSRRQQHEADQSRIWALFAWEQVRDREIAFRPLYRFKLQPDDNARTAVLRGAILYLRTADKSLAEALDSIDADQSGTFSDLQQHTKSAYAVLQQSMADALFSPKLGPDECKEGEAIKSLCKQGTEECTVIADNYNKAMESDVAKEDTSKLAFREQLQSSLARLTSIMAELDQRLMKDADAWHITPVAGTDSPDKLPVWPAHVAKAVTPAVNAVPIEPTVLSPSTPPVPPSDGGTPLLDRLTIKLGAVSERSDGLLQITVKNHKGDGRVDTDAEYATPLVISAVAKTSSQNLRLFYGDSGMIIFNWELGERRFRHHDPKTGAMSEVTGQGGIPKDDWVTVRWIIGNDESRIEVDGVTRAAFKGNYNGLSGRVGIGTHGNNTITVKSFQVKSGSVGSASPTSAAN